MANSFPNMRKLTEEESAKYTITHDLGVEEREECASLLKMNSTFRFCSDSRLLQLCKKAEKVVFNRGDDMIRQADPQSHMFLLSKGEILRLRTMDGQLHHMEIPERQTLYGSLHVLKEDPSFATCKCVSDACTVYRIKSSDYKSCLSSDPAMAQEVLYGLSREIRSYYKLQRTPLFEQRASELPVLATSMAASVESYYRSALNAMLNQRLTGQKASWFPNMHVQIPSRVLYITGFKGIRYQLEKSVDASQFSYSKAVAMGLAFTPGLLMTPLSSVLEASNAGHMNPRPLYARWTCGVAPRAAREVVFGVGLNQLSDFVTERMPHGINLTLRTALGSMGAGVLAAYLSHIPHNLSTLKLLQPELSYAQHFANLAKSSTPWLPEDIPPAMRTPLSYVGAVIAPRGVLIRSVQIMGSFVILNGTIHLLRDVR